ncbi:uncharacterized protein DMENIID0001_150970 [Sergentomyia squamirostris]
MLRAIAALVIFAGLVTVAIGHGRMIEPPSRASAWRYGFNTPPNYNDHELFCGGFSRQWQRNEGKCGVCGDAFDTPEPRDNEFGGKYGLGVIVRRYNPGSDFLIRIELTASHWGYFEFRVCPDVSGKQDCLDENLLEILSGSPAVVNVDDASTRFYPRNGSRVYEIRARLPQDLKCESCLLQWIYVAGNNWGMCENGTGAVGCGPQEQFRACADISIGYGAPPPSLRPIRPGTKTTPKTKMSEATKLPPGAADEPMPEGPKYIGALIAIITLILVLCCLAVVYLYHYHGQRIKHLMRWQRTKNPTTGTHLTSVESAPVPPPRTKRQSHHGSEIDARESSILTGSNSPPPGARNGGAQMPKVSPECA